MKANPEENISKKISRGTKVGHFSGKTQCLSLLGCSEGGVCSWAVGCAAHMCTVKKANAEV